MRWRADVAGVARTERVHRRVPGLRGAVQYVSCIGGARHHRGGDYGGVHTETVGKVFFGPLDERWEKLPDASNLEKVSMLALVAVLIFGGVYPQPFTRMIDVGIAPILARIAAA